jgi:ATP-dependent RNA helicase DDX54/DBP10
MSPLRPLTFDTQAAQLNEILLSLPPSRQTMLFSATMPKSLAEFARAGLQDPKLVRLDVESKLSSDLQSAFFTVKSTEKEGALLHILQDIIQMPIGAAGATMQGDAKKRKRAPDRSSHKDAPSSRSTIIFTATKHHVEYVSTLLQAAGYAVSYGKSTAPAV